MPKFRKKPVVIEAVQLLEGEVPPPGVIYCTETGRPYVVTIHGQRCYVVTGDWIIPEPDGKHFYPCKADIFKATYEAFDSVNDARVERVSDEDLARMSIRLTAACAYDNGSQAGCKACPEYITLEQLKLLFDETAVGCSDVIPLAGLLLLVNKLIGTRAKSHLVTEPPEVGTPDPLAEPSKLDA